MKLGLAWSSLGFVLLLWLKKQTKNKSYSPSRSTGRSGFRRGGQRFEQQGVVTHRASAGSSRKRVTAKTSRHSAHGTDTGEVTPSWILTVHGWFFLRRKCQQWQRRNGNEAERPVYEIRSWCKVNYYTRSQYLTGPAPGPSVQHPDSILSGTEGRASVKHISFVALHKICIHCLKWPAK